MEEEPDYTRCALHELVDVAQRIDRKRFPQRYARVLAEIEKRQQNSASAAPAPVARSNIRILVGWVAAEYLILIGLGIVWPIAVYNSPNAPPTDMPMGFLFVPFTIILLLFCACGFGAMRWALRSIDDQKLVLKNALVAVLWAPFALIIGFITMFPMPFEMPQVLRTLWVFASFSAPFLLGWWLTKRAVLDKAS